MHSTTQILTCGSITNRIERFQRVGAEAAGCDNGPGDAVGAYLAARPTEACRVVGRIVEGIGESVVASRSNSVDQRQCDNALAQCPAAVAIGDCSVCTVILS